MASSSAAERAGLAVAALFLGAALHGLGAADVVGDDEAREVGIVQDVLAGHWLLPRFNAELLPDKPILWHWLAALPAAAAGPSATAVRLPSALAGAALVAWTARFGATLGDPRAGVAAAVLLATTPAFFTRARVARPDVLLALLLALALGRAFRWWRDGRPADATAALAWLGAATGAKGPVGPTLFVATLGGFLLWQGELRRLPRLLTPAGLAAFALVGLGWYAVALAGWGDLFVREHLIGRYLRNLLGGLPAGQTYSPEPFLYHLLFYVQHLPLVVLPWTPIVAVGLWQAARSGGLGTPHTRFLLCWAAAPVLAFTPAEWKLRYYLLPALPALVLVAAPAAVRLWAARGAPGRGGRAVVAALLAAGLAAAAVWAAGTGQVALSRSDRATFDGLVVALPGGLAGTAALAAGAAGVLALAAAARAWRVVLAVTAGGMAAWMLLGLPALERAVSRRDSLRPFAEAVARTVPRDAPLVFFPETMRPVAVYAGRAIPPVRRRRDLPPGAFVIAAEPAWRDLHAAGRVGMPLLEGHGRHGNVDRGRVILARVP